MSALAIVKDIVVLYRLGQQQQALALAQNCRDDLRRTAFNGRADSIQEINKFISDLVRIIDGLRRETRISGCSPDDAYIPVGIEQIINECFLPELAILKAKKYKVSRAN